jgi:phosphoribosylformimino-5-aminoimidazole carboxamide ribotide isomerase
MSFTVYPAVDIAQGKCVRLLQGRFGTETVYSDDPVEVALGFAKAGARWLHIVDLDGARTGVGTNRELVLEVVAKAACPVQAGGGLRGIDDVVEVLAAGANRAVLGTVALEDPAALRRACGRFGERIAVSLDARGAGSAGPQNRIANELTGHGWTVGSGTPLLDAVRVFEEAGASMFIYTDVSRDGTMSGPNLEGVARLAEHTTRPVIASGGVATLDELRAVARLHGDGVRGVIVGRALYESKFTVMEAIRAADEASIDE